jgi:hypothetical protein
MKFEVFPTADILIAVFGYDTMQFGRWVQMFKGKYCLHLWGESEFFIISFSSNTA